MSQQVRTAPGDPRRGAIPVELIRCQPFGDFPIMLRGAEGKCQHGYIAKAV
ncbi:hypothetical protein NE619_18115 [Anaerovorax odorimutans]|uniref:Uncharacterized protein n=2 Tax=Anaerovorax odorimutans TaxID=109327 RepID=A0ABT1RTW0_9FIRM|nr:hypothetical protein [Anaerovorax odorimutans]